MLGLIVLIVMGGYLALSIFLVIVTYRSVKKKGRTGRKAWLPAVMVGLVMYLLVFWDHVPTIVAHKYYCDKYAGFTVYKTVEQWKAENPGAIKTLSNKNKPASKKNGDVIRSWINNQIYVERTQTWNEDYWLIGNTKETVFDVKSKEILAESVDYWRGYANALSLGASDYRGLKFWLYKGSCEGGETSPSELMYQFRKKMYKMGDRK